MTVETQTAPGPDETQIGYDEEPVIPEYQPEPPRRTIPRCTSDFCAAQGPFPYSGELDLENGKTRTLDELTFVLQQYLGNNNEGDFTMHPATYGMRIDHDCIPVYHIKPSELIDVDKEKAKNVSTGHPFILGDEDNIQEVYENLLKGFCDYMGNGTYLSEVYAASRFFSQSA